MNIMSIVQEVSAEQIENAQLAALAQLEASKYFANQFNMIAFD